MSTRQKEMIDFKGICWVLLLLFQSVSIGVVIWAINVFAIFFLVAHPVFLMGPVPQYATVFFYPVQLFVDFGMVQYVPLIVCGIHALVAIFWYGAAKNENDRLFRFCALSSITFSVILVLIAFAAVTISLSNVPILSPTK